MPFGSPNTAAALLQNTRLFFDFPLFLADTDTDLEVFCRVEDGFVAESGGLISQVDDRTVHDEHATQGSALLQPDLDTTSWSRWAAMFNGGTVLKHADTLASAMPSNNWSFWVVFRADSTAGNQGIWCISALAGGYSLTIEGAKWTIRHQPSGTTQDGNADTNFHWIVASRIAGVDHLLVNGVEVTLGATPTAPTSPSAISTIGALLDDLTFPFAGWVHEWGALSRPFTGAAPGVGNAGTGECAQLAAYVNAWYA